MKRIGLGTIFALIVSLAVFSYAQQPAGQDSGGANQEQPTKHQEVQPPPREPGVKPPQDQEEAKPPKPQHEAKPPRAERQESQRPSSEQKKPAHEQHGNAAEQPAARPSGKSARIPDPQFKAKFGKPHTFTVNRVVTTTTVVPNQTQFIYGGYTFIFLDPWPADWLFTDECYVDYMDDEYFLFDVLHPGVRVALFVVG